MTTKIITKDAYGDSVEIVSGARLPGLSATNTLMITCDHFGDEIYPVFTQEQIKELLPSLQHFADTGELPNQLGVK